MEKVQIILLGKQRLPLYGKTDEDKVQEKVIWYKIIPNGNYRNGDGIFATLEEQCAFCWPINLEIYNALNFEDDGYSLEKYINEKCINLIEIYND